MFLYFCNWDFLENFITCLYEWKNDWMVFAFFLTVFQSYQDDGGENIKGFFLECIQKG